MDPKMQQLLVAAVLTNAFHYQPPAGSTDPAAGENTTILSFERWYLFIGAAMADTTTFTPPAARSQSNPLAGMVADPAALKSLAATLAPLLGLAGPAGAAVGAVLGALPPVAAPGIASGTAATPK